MITLDMLKEKNADKEVKDWFKEHYPDGVSRIKLIEALIRNKQFNWLQWTIRYLTDDISPERKIEMAIKLSLIVDDEANYITWANKWLSGEDRSEESAEKWVWASSLMVGSAAWAVSKWAAKAARAVEGVSNPASWAAVWATSWAVKNDEEKTNKIINILAEYLKEEEI